MNLPPDLPSNEELHKALERLDAVEATAAKNAQRSRNAWAIAVLAVFAIPFFLFTGEVEFGEKFSAKFKSRDIDMSEFVSLLGFGLMAVGAIGHEELLALIKKK